MLLPSARDAAGWFVDTAHAACRAGERLDPDAVRLLMTLAPDDPAIPAAIERLDSEPDRRHEQPGTSNAEPGTSNVEPGTPNPNPNKNQEPGTRNPEPPSLASYARGVTEQLRLAVSVRDEARARETVTALETELLRAYRPAYGLGSFEDDVTVSLALLTAYDIGADQTHLMMAEELLRGVVRREWERRAQHGLRANCEAAIAFAALAARTENADYRERALEIMGDYASSYRSLGARAAPYVSALQVIS